MPLIDCQGMFPLDLEHAIGKAALIQFGKPFGGVFAACVNGFCRFHSLSV